MSVSEYGAVVTSRDVRLALQDTLKDWLPATLAEVARQAGVDPRKVPTPMSWHRLSNPDDYRDDQLPAVVVASPGLVGPPAVEYSGLVTKTWEVIAAAVVRGDSHEDVADLGSLYTAAIEMAAMQNRDLGGRLDAVGATGCDVSLLDNRSPDVGSRWTRTLADVYVVFAVEVAGVLDISVGPAEPPTDPYA